MKKIIFGMIISIVGSATAFANAFDNFVGEYDLTSTPIIQKSSPQQYCNKYGFSQMTGLKIEKYNLGYGQSHMIYFLNSALWMTHAVLDYDYQDVTIGSYARTTGSDSEAISEFGTWQTNPNGKTNLKVTIQKSSTGFLLLMHELWSENEKTTAECSYQVSLKKI